MAGRLAARGGVVAVSVAVRISGLEKRYSKGFRALKGIDLEVREGEIFGLIGPNGAGKSTTMRILATLIRPTGGTATVAGRDVVREAAEVRKVISYLPEDAGAYENLSGRENLAFTATFYAADPKAIVDLGVEIAGLGERIDSRVKEYSKGMKRRLMIARALMTSPRLAILDEATSGLDVIHAQHVRKRIRDVIRRDNSTAIISSHNLLEVDYLCDRVALIDEGTIHEVGTPAGLKEKYAAANLEDVFVEVVQHA